MDGKKSAGDENEHIMQINAWAYLDGKLDAAIYREDSRMDCTLWLYKGVEYHIYTLAGAGEITPPVYESEIKDLLLYMDNENDLSGKRLASYSCGRAGYTPHDGALLCIQMERMSAGIQLCIVPGGTVASFHMERGSLNGAPAGVFAFGGQQENDCPESCSYSIDEKDMEILNDGGVIQLGCLEKTDSEPMEICLQGRFSINEFSEDRSSCYTREHDMQLRIPIAGPLFRNHFYRITVSYSDYGWVSDTGHYTVGDVVSDGSHSVSFCNAEGRSLSSAELPPEETVSAYFMVYPPSLDGIAIESNIPFSSLNLFPCGSPVHCGKGIYRIDYENHYGSRVSDRYFTLRISDPAHGISSSCEYLLKAAESHIDDYISKDNESIIY